MTALVLAAALLLQASGRDAGMPDLAYLDRSYHQDGGAWVVDYRFRAGADMAVRREDIAIRVEGDLSNSDIPAHAFPRRSSATLDGRSSPAAYAEVIHSSDESARCRERIALAILGPDGTPGAEAPAGGTLIVRLRLEHEHPVYGEHEPLLGRRQVEMRVGATTVRDELSLTREERRAIPTGTWEAPEDRRDRRTFASAPDSLRLACDGPGENYFRFPERRVRRDTPMRLSFRYKVAPGSEGPLFARLVQYRATPERYRCLSEASLELPLGAPAHWARFERTFRTHAEANEAALDFRLAPGDVGEAWVDDVVLEPVEGATPSP